MIRNLTGEPIQFRDASGVRWNIDPEPQPIPWQENPQRFQGPPALGDGFRVSTVALKMPAPVHKLPRPAHNTLLVVEPAVFHAATRRMDVAMVEDSGQLVVRWRRSMPHWKAAGELSVWQAIKNIVHHWWTKPRF